MRLSNQRIRSALFLCAFSLQILFLAYLSSSSPDLFQFSENKIHFNSQYYLLKNYLDKYEKIKSDGGLTKFQTMDTLKAGIVDSKVILLRDYLALTGDLIQDHPRKVDSFDTGLENAVKKFQSRNGIIESGMIDKTTLEKLNIPIEKRIHQIKINMERWKYLPTDTESFYIIVNTANFKLEVIEHDSILLDMKVVVGRLYRSTPVFDARMLYMDFNPYWYIPPGILKRDILPKIAKDPTYLARMDMKVIENSEDGSTRQVSADSIDWKEAISKPFPYSIVQDPGSENPMGKIKFLFPNRYNVYLHDTPSKELFEKPEPMYSSGCIRISKARELAGILVKKNSGWNMTKVDSITESGKTVRMNLSIPTKVYIQYFTSWVNSKGELQFREDIYKRDN